MDKRGARILFGCLAGTVIVVLLFLLASRLTQPSCELIVIEQSQHRSSAQAEWSKEKPLKTHDKTTLIKISAYLEYNIQKDGVSKQDKITDGQNHNNLSQQAGQDMFSLPVSSNNQQQQQHPPQQPAANPPTTGQGQQLQPQQQQQQPQLPNNQPSAQVPAQASSQQQNASGMSTTGKGPVPSTPQSAFTSQQLANSSFPLLNQTTLATASTASGSSSSSSDSKSEKPRFLPLKLDDIEIKKTEDNKYTYTLNFNCSTMKLHFVRRPEKVFIEKVTLKLKPDSQKESKCELQLPNGEMFSADVSSADGWAHYYCDKPLKYSCYHYSSNKPALLLADLHINGFEYETTGTAGSQQQQQSGGGNMKPIHKSTEFLGVRGRVCAGV